MIPLTIEAIQGHIKEIDQRLRELHESSLNEDSPPEFDLLIRKRDWLKSIVTQPSWYFSEGKDIINAKLYQYDKFQQYACNNTSIHFSQVSLNLFKAKVRGGTRYLEKALRIFPAQDKLQKVSRKRINQGKGFSLLRSSTACYLVSSLTVSPPTARSIVKVIFPIIQQGHVVNIRFSTPMAVKIVYYPASFSSTTAIAAMEYMQGLQPEVFSVNGVTKAKQYQIMPLFSGENLFEFINNRGVLFDGKFTLSLSFQHKLLLCKATAQSVQNLHEKNFVHNDIKPENFMIEKNQGSFKATLIDVDDVCFVGRSLPNRPVGTSIYSAPEYSRSTFCDNITANKTADIWSLGRVFVDIFTCIQLDGRNLFAPRTENSVIEFMDKYDCNDPPHLQSKAKIKSLLDLMLSENSGQRPSIAQVIAMLDDSIAGLSVSSFSSPPSADTSANPISTDVTFTLSKENSVPEVADGSSAAQSLLWTKDTTVYFSDASSAICPLFQPSLRSNKDEQQVRKSGCQIC